MTSTPLKKRGANLKISEKKKKTQFAHNATKVVSAGRGIKKKLYWDQRSGSWKSTKNKPIGDGLKRDFSKTIYKTKKNYELKKNKVNKDSEKSLEKINNARKKGIAPSPDLRGTATKNQPNTDESKKDTKDTKVVKTNNNKENQVVKKEDKKEVVEKKEVKKDPLAKYRRTKGEGYEKKTKDQRGDTRITKKLKKAGFTETRLAKLRAKNAAFQKAKKGGKEAMKKYREKYPKRG